MPIRFGDFTLDESRRQLLRSGEAVRLSPKAYQLLSLLIAQSPKAVSKTDLQEHLWPDTFVGEGSLATLVTEVRSALGDGAREQRFIRTLYGFGYAFAAPLRDSAESAPPARRGLGHLTGAAAFGAMAVIFLLAFRSTNAETHAVPQPIRSIAVLPFDATAADAADRHLGLGLSDLVITRLSRLRQFVVRPTSAVRAFESQRGDSAEIGRKLKVDAVVDGSIRTTPDRVRVTVQLLDVHDQKTIWADRFDTKRADMFSLEDDISARVADALTQQLSPRERALLARRETRDPEAYQLYIQGRYHLQRLGAGRYYAADAKTGLDFLQKAVAKDPSFAAAWAALADAYMRLAALGQMPPSTTWPAGESAARTALQLDPDRADANASLGIASAYWDLDFTEAEKRFRRALALNPRDPEALMGYGVILQDLGRFDESLAVRQHLIDVDPLNLDYQWGVANVYVTSGQYDRAKKQILMILAMDPNHAEARIGLSRIYMATGEPDKAIAELRQLTERNGDNRSLAFLGYALAKTGRVAEARQILQTLDDPVHVPRAREFHRAVVYAGLGDVDGMFSMLDQALTDRTYAVRLKTEPVFAPYRSDPRFVALLQRAGFKE